MIYDLRKIFKKILKYSYILVATLLIFSVGFLLTKNVTYEQSVSYNISFIDKNDMDYYEKAQEQIIKEILLNHVTIENNVEKNYQDVSVYISQKSYYDVKCLNIRILSSKEDACKTEIVESTKSEIESYVRENIISDYQNAKTTAKSSIVEYDGVKECKNYNDHVLVIGVLLCCIEAFGLIVWGMFDSKIISKRELEDKFNLKILFDLKKDGEFLSSYLNSSKTNDCVLYYCDGFEQIKEFFGLSDISQASTKTELLKAKKVFICVKIRKTTEQEIAHTLDHLNNFGIKDIAFIVR